MVQYGANGQAPICLYRNKVIVFKSIFYNVAVFKTSGIPYFMNTFAQVFTSLLIENFA